VTGIFLGAQLFDLYKYDQYQTLFLFFLCGLNGNFWGRCRLCTPQSSVSGYENDLVPDYNKKKIASWALSNFANAYQSH
jgi:hypothetical protein